MTMENTPPEADEFELTLFGPGYGESIVLHVGNGVWVIVDSCIDNNDKTPRALRYLKDIGVDPVQAVALIVATHWHDDHIRGMAQLTDACSQAAFCCAGALCKQEFLAAIAALEHRHLTVAGSGVRELYNVFMHLQKAKVKPIFAIANRCIFTKDKCKIWSLSPSDTAFHAFLGTIGNLMPFAGQPKKRVPDPSANDVAIALWIEVGDVVVLLGSDLERPGWVEILQSAERPSGHASALKIAHHGSDNADEPKVWQEMLDANPFAVLTPWKRGQQFIPKPRDVTRILNNTTNAYASARSRSVTAAPTRRNPMVDRTIRNSGVKLQRRIVSPGAVRLRRPIGRQTSWQVKLFGAACRLEDFN